jgi:hypothetical protein
MAGLQESDNELFCLDEEARTLMGLESAAKCPILSPFPWSACPPFTNDARIAISAVGEQDLERGVSL